MAKAAELFFTGKPCKNGHIDKRYLSSGLCLTCVRERNTRNAWAEKNPERRRQTIKRYRDANREKAIAASRRSIAKRPHVPMAWRQANSERVRQYKRAWDRRNPEFVALRKRRRRLARPAWVDVRDLARIARECRRVSKDTGIKHHVDHIVPLVGKTVCGLDVPWNLQIVPADLNQRKSNKFLDELS